MERAERMLEQRRKDIAADWTRRALAAYSSESARTFGANFDPFRNPIGGVTRRCAEAIVAEALGRSGDDADHDADHDALQQFVKMRAVQDMPPSQAVGVIFELKRSLAEAAFDGMDHPAAPRLQREANDRVEGIVLRAFDLYSACRESIFELRLDQARQRAMGMMGRPIPGRHQPAAACSTDCGSNACEPAGWLGGEVSQ